MSICFVLQLRQLNIYGISNSRYITNNNYINYVSGRLCVIQLLTPFLQAYQHQFGSFSTFASNLKTEAKIKGNTMVQWINIHWNNSFVNLM